MDYTNSAEIYPKVTMRTKPVNILPFSSQNSILMNLLHHPFTLVLFHKMKPESINVEFDDNFLSNNGKDKTEFAYKSKTTVRIMQSNIPTAFSFFLLRRVLPWNQASKLKLQQNLTFFKRLFETLCPNVSQTIWRRHSTQEYIQPFKNYQPKFLSTTASS